MEKNSRDLRVLEVLSRNAYLMEQLVVLPEANPNTITNYFGDEFDKGYPTNRSCIYPAYFIYADSIKDFSKEDKRILFQECSFIIGSAENFIYVFE